MRSRWPRGLRIHPANNPLLALPDTHPAKQTIIAHAECRRDCVGHEIEWPGQETFEQDWQSCLLGRRFSFSSYAYCFLSFDLILKEWISRPLHVTNDERWLVAAIPLQDALLGECEVAAKEQSNDLVLNRLPQIRGFNGLRLESIARRLEDDGLEMLEPPVNRNPLELLGLHYPGG